MIQDMILLIKLFVIEKKYANIIGSSRKFTVDTVHTYMSTDGKPQTHTYIYIAISFKSQIIEYPEIYPVSFSLRNCFNRKK